MIKALNIKSLVARQEAAVRDVHASLADVRERRLALLAERERIANAPIPLDAAELALDAWLDEIAGGVNFSVRSLAYPTWNSRPSLGFIRRPDTPMLDAQPAVMQVFSLLVASNRAGVRDLFARALADDLEGIETVTNADRARRLGALDAEILAIERAEEQLIREAEVAGLPILRREDARPEIVLLSDAALAA